MDLVAGVDHGPAQADGQHCLAHSRRPDEQNVGGVVQKAQALQLQHELFVHRGLSFEVEVGDPPGGGQAGQAGKGGEPAGVGGGHFEGEQPLQQRGGAPAFGLGLVEQAGQGLGRRAQVQVGEVASQGLVGRCLGHAVTSVAPGKAA